MMKPATVFLSVIVRFLRNGYGDRDWNIGRTWITKLGGTRHLIVVIVIFLLLNYVDPMYQITYFFVLLNYLV